ncbi:restriction endonuclease subunit S [Aneurinibacillus aneurinilyticus]|jgi:type I restriction enzyme S subunit|uniref:restriction endonuclease subunit S n=1 Tax=Aneurinibacillus aneurinilyticus TaxID=1391 RepID=UPI0023F8A2AE|nr:restriction endonuclease subunit S [Aneurinibacillus aneurinilyticus]MCI1696814.1 restriction endonuclease subunit S [Aneurinibacillus aneurinilyticus]
MSNTKESHVQWLGEVPKNWRTLKLKFLCDINTGSKDTQDKLPDGKYPFFVRSPHVESLDEFTHNEEAIMTAGDGVGVGKVFHYYEGKFAAHQRVYVFTKFKDIIGKYLYYYLMSNLKFEVLMGGAKSTVDSIRRPMLSEFPVVFPDLELQKKIVRFLDRKIKQINDLISLKQNYVELIEEQRQSIITEAVTKGLNPNVKMKDSGIEWIGEIPEHWELSKVGYLGRLQNGISKSSDEFGFGTPFISYGDVYKNEVLPKVASGLVNATEEDKKLYSVEYGDVFFTRTSETIEEIGIASTCFETIDEATFAGFLIRFRPKTNRLSPRFARFYFRSALGKRYFVKEMNLVTRASLSQALLRNFTVLLPSLKEQEEIASYLEQKTAAIEESITHIKIQIEKLKEYRQALIYEAVTGKIDVRDMELDLVR